MASTGNEFSGWVNPFESADQPADEFSGWVNPFEAQKPATSPVNAIADIGVSAASGANMMLELAGSLYGLTTGDMENAVRTYGAKGREFWETKKSPYLKQLEADRRAKVDAAEGEWAKLGTAAWTTLTSPSLLASYTAEQLPNLLVTGGAGTAARTGLIAGARLAGKKVGKKAADRAALGGAIGAGGAMQGSDVGASAYDQLMALPDEVWLTNPDFQSRINGNMDLLPRVKREMAAELSKDSAIIATAASIGINSIPVFRMLEERLVGIPGAGGRLAGAGKGFVGESLGEGLEEGSGAMLSNLATSRVDPNQPLMAGVGEAAGMGLAAGPLGAIGGALRRPEVDSAREADVARTIFEAPTIDESIAAASEALTTMEMPGVDFEAPTVPRQVRPGYETIPGSGIPIIEFDATGLPFRTEQPSAPGSQMQGIDFRTQRDDETDAAYAIRMEQEQARRDQDFPAAIEQKEEQDAIRAELSPAAAPANPAIANALLGAYIKDAPESAQEAAKETPATPTSQPPLPVFTGRADDSGQGWGASRGSIADGTKQTLLVDAAGNYFWGERNLASARDTGRVIEGAHKEFEPAKFESTAEAREAASKTTATTPAAAAIEPTAAPATVEQQESQFIPIESRRTIVMPSGNPFSSEKIAKASLSYRNTPGAKIVTSGNGFAIEISDPKKSITTIRAAFQEADKNNDLDAMGSLGRQADEVFIPAVKSIIDSGSPVVFEEGGLTKVLTPSSKEPGRYQVTVYNKTGALSDTSHDTIEQITREVDPIVANILTPKAAEAKMQELGKIEADFQKRKAQSEGAGRQREIVDYAKKAKSLAEVRAFAVKQYGEAMAKSLDSAAVSAWNIRNQEQRRKIKDSDTIAVAVAKLGGIKPEYQQDITGDTTINKMVPGIGQVFSKNGTSPDDMALKLLEEGYITQAQYDNMDGRDTLYEALNDDLSGRRKVYRVDSLKAQEEMLQELENQYEAEEQALQSRREQMYSEIEQEYGAEAAERARLYDDAQDNTTDDLLSDIDILNEQNQERDDARETDNEPGITFDEATGNRERVREAEREAQREPAKAKGSEAQDRRAEPAVAAKPAAKEENPNPKITIQIAADSIEKLRAQDVERVISEAFGIGEDHLFDVYMYIANNRPDLQQTLRGAFDDVAPFLTESGNRMLSVMAQSSVRRTTGESEKQAILDKHGDDLSGLQLSSNDGERFVLFTPEAGEPGKVRATYFFERGFSGHSTRSSYAKLLDEMFQEGYRKEVPGKLEELSQTKEFVDGNEYASMLQKVNSGQMTHKQMLEGLEKKKASEKPAAKEMTDLTDAEYKAILEDARYLKDVTYSLSGFDGVTIDQKLKLNDAIGNKSSRDALLMRAFGISRSAAHDINNSLDAKPVRKLRPVDIQEAFETFPGLKDSADEILGADGQHVVESMASEKPAKRSRITPETAGDMKSGDIVVDDNGNEFVAMGSRHKWMDAAPIVNGKAQVSADTVIRFHLADDGRDLYEGRNFSPIYATGRNLYEDGNKQSPAQDAESRHSGYRVYKTSIKRDGGAVERWALQSNDNLLREQSGERQIGGDTLFATKDEAIAEADEQALAAERDQEAQDARDRQEREAAEKAASRKTDDINGFTSGMSAMAAGRIKSALEKQIRFRDAGVMSIRERVESLAKSGSLELSTFTESKIKPLSRAQFNRATQREQDAHERKMREAGDKTVYLVNDSDLGKTGYDYAQHMLSKKAPAQKPASEMSASELLRAAADKMDAEKVAAQPEVKTERQQDAFGLTGEDAASIDQQIESLRSSLTDLEDRIVGSAGLAPGFIEDAMRSRKVPSAMKDRAKAMRQQLRDLRSEKERVQKEASEDQALPATQETSLEDFGVKLGGARKDQARMASMDKDMTADEIAGKTLSEIWPKSEVDAIEDKDTAAFVYGLRSVIPSKPRKSYALSKWAAEVQMLRNLVRHYSRDPERVERGLREGSDALKSFADKIDLLRLIDRDQWGRIGKVVMYPNAMRNIDGKTISSPSMYVSIDGITTSVSASTVKDAAPEVNEKLDGEPRGKSDKYEIRGYKNTNEWFIIKKGDSEYRRLKSFSGESALTDAKKYKAQNVAELDAAWEAVKERDNISKTDVRNEENRPRTGKDYRNGKDVTPEQFSSQFGFRGVEFGNWVTQGKNAKERQGMLNGAYDALMDLAEIVGIPPKAVSLNGSMGLAFGSRGSGSASAHFEPDNLVINLTKTKGAGTLAHEWFHALDNYFSRMRSGEVKVSGIGGPNAYRENNYITYKPEPMYVRKGGGSPMIKADLERRRAQNPNSGYFKEENWMIDPKHPEGVRPEVERAFAELVEALGQSPMTGRAKAIDQGKLNGYWSRIIERAARSFENYVITKMHNDGYDNDYLANVKAWESWGDKNPERYPYLKPEEIAPVAEAFDALFSTIKTRETDSGIALFSRDNETPVSSKREDNKSLYVAHNLTAENLRHADEIGGLAAPSLAIADIEKGAFDSFGEITLLADPSITQTRGARTFNADVYSPRHPRAQIRIKQKEYNSLIDRLDAATGDMRFLENPSMDEIESHGARALAGNSAFMYAHLKDKGISIKPVRDTKTDPAIRKAAALIEKLPYSSKYEWYNNTSNPDLQKMAEDHYREINDKYAAARGKDLGFFDDDGTLSVHLTQRFVADATRYAKSKGIDSTATKAAIAKKFRTAAMSNDLEQEAGREFNKLLKDRVIFKGFTNSGNRRYAAYNMDNILAEMTKTIRNGEGFDYGAGSVRSKYAAEIKSIQEMRNRKSELVPEEEMKAIKKESQDKLFEAMDALRPHYKYDKNSSRYYSDAASAIAEGRSGLREAFKSSPAVDRIAADIISYLKNLPTQYFETKMQRAVGLNEFKTAIVPRGTSQDVIGILEKNGVSVRYYKPGDKDSRVKAIKAEKDILFSKRQPTARRSVIPLDRAQALVSSITSRFENAPEVIVVQNMNDEQVPELVRQEDAKQRSQGAKGDPEGFYYKGKAYIVLDGVSLKRGETAEQAVLRVFSHEVLGHAGLRGLFRGDLEKVLLEVAIKRRDDVRRKAQSYGLDIADRADRMTAAEEVLAELAQSQPENSLVTKAIEAVRRALRRMLMRLPAEARQMLGGSKFIEWVNSMTDAEIIDRFIVPAREFIRGGKEAALDAMPSFVRSGGTWYRSDLQQNIGQIRQMANKQGMIGKDQAKQWIDAAIKKGLFKAEEVEWTGLKEFIDTASDKVSVDDIQAFADSNGVQVEDVVYGGIPFETLEEEFAKEGYDLEGDNEGLHYIGPDGKFVEFSDLPKNLQDMVSNKGDDLQYGNYQLPGGENYREVLLTLPTLPDELSVVKHPDGSGFALQRPDDSYVVSGPDSVAPGTVKQWESRQFAEDYGRNAHDRVRAMQYRSSHWDKPNVLAHIRMNDRIDAEGNKVLFIEEIQSDWAQEGRKKGFKQSYKPDDVVPIAADSQEATEPNLFWYFRVPGNVLQISKSRYATEEAAKQYVVKEKLMTDGAPAAPFVTNTKSWTSLALKRIIAMAAEGDYDKVAFINGEQSADRYDLSKQVKRVVWNEKTGTFAAERSDSAGARDDRPAIREEGVTAEKLADIIGKDAAKRLIDSKESGGWRAIEGDDLKVGGSGMKAFYDQIVPAALKDIVKKIGGGQIETVNFAGTKAPKKEEGWRYEEVENDDGEGDGPYTSFDIYNAQDEYVSTVESAAEAERAIEHFARGVRAAIGEYKDTTGAGQQLGITITDAMRKKAESGLSLFSRDMFGSQEGFDLDQYTEQDIAGQQRSKTDREKAEALRKQRQQADDQVDDFALTGSNSEADQMAARGQRSLFSRNDSTGFAIPDETLTTQAIRIIQDKFKVLKDLQANIIEAGGTIAEKANAYIAEELFHGKAENDLREMRDQYVEPLAEKMAKFDIDRDSLDQYLIAKHARERNAHIASINPKMQDGGSGMTNAEARTALAKVAASGKQDQYDQLAGIVYDMLQLQRDMIKQGGLEDEGLIDAWQDQYQFYVPLKGFAEDTKGEGIPRTGKGFNISGRESKRALGRSSEAASPTSYAIVDLTEKLIRRRKNEVGNAFLQLIQDNPNPDFWEVFTEDRPETDRKIKKVRDPETGLMVEQVGEAAIPMAMMKDRYFTTKRNGKTYYMKINTDIEAGKNLMRAMKNIGPESNGAIIRTMASINRVLSALNTSYAPEFVISNFSRDIQAAVLKLSAEQTIEGSEAEGIAIATQVVKDVPAAMKAVYASLRGNKLKGEGAQWQAAFEQFRKDGAKTGWFDMKDLDGQSRDIDRLVEIAQGGFKGNAMRYMKASAGFVENLNQAVENAVRLSAYVNAINAGVSRQGAASLAKNLTVNFNRRGEIGSVLNSFYMFANASIQGSANFLRTMATLNGDKRLRWGNLNNAQKIAVGLAAGAYFVAMANRMAAGEDDDDENWFDKVPDYVKERNLVIMKSLFGGPQDGSYWKIPLPYGFNVFYVLGQSIESVVGGGNSPVEAAGNMVLATLGSFSPIGFQQSETVTGAIAKNIAPTVFKPIVEVVANENFAGSSIYSTNFPFGVQKPDSALGRRSTPEAYRAFAQWLNETTGGSEFRPGAVDINPDVMQHFLDYFGGSAYAFFGSKLPEFAYRSASQVPTESAQTPFISRISGRVMPYADQDKFYQRRERLEQIREEYRSLPAAERIRYEFRDQLKLLPIMKATEDRLSAMRKQRGVIYNADIPLRERDQRLKVIEMRMKAAVDTFNKQYNAID